MMNSAVTLEAKVTQIMPRGTVPLRPQRRVMFDVMRLVAAYGIVWLHTPRSEALAGWSVLGRFAVPFFVAATIFFIWQGLVKRPSQSLVRYAISRFERIYLPFLAWSLVYLAFKAIKAQALPEEANDFPGIEFLWAGSFFHLWFMPFILVVSLAVFALARSLVRRPLDEITVGMCCAAGGLVIGLSPAPSEWSGTSWELAWNALASVAWGAALAVAYHRGCAAWLEKTTTAVWALVIAVAAMAFVSIEGRSNVAENLSGVACVVVALAPWNGPWLGWLARLGPLAYGIYLSHMLFIKGAEALLNKLDAPLAWWLDVIVFLFAAVSSTALAWLLSRFRATRWLAA